MTDSSAQTTKDPDTQPRRRRDRKRARGSALQAISDATGRTIGYELFYRASSSADSASERTTAATLQVLASHVGSVPGGTGAYFVNVTRDFLVGEVPLPDPTEVAVLEVQPDVLVDGAVLDGAIRLRDRGYGIALDRYLPGQSNRHDLLLPFASHVKLDVDEVADDTLRKAVAFVREHSNALVIGTKIGTAQGYELARELGCDLFQGWEVEAVQQRNAKAISGTLSRYIELLELLAADGDPIDIARVVVAVMGDADLSARVLNACDSASTVLDRPMTSIRQAIVLLGANELRRRVHIAVAQGLGVRDGGQLVGLVEYASLAELVGQRLELATGSGFLAGLLSQVAEATGTPIHEVLTKVPVAPELAAGLRGQRGTTPETAAVRDTLAVVDAYQGGEPIPAIEGLTLTAEELEDLHTEAMLVAAGLSSTPGADGQQADTPHALPPVWSPAAADGDGVPGGAAVLDPSEGRDRGESIADGSVADTSAAGASGAGASVTGTSAAGASGAGSSVAGAPVGGALVVAEAYRPLDEWAREHACRMVREGSILLAAVQGSLGLAIEELRSLVEEGGVLVVEVDGVDYVPRWQFTAEGGVLPGLADLLTCFPGDRLELAEWLTRPTAALAGQLPVLLLSRGQHQAVIDHVLTMRAARREPAVSAVSG